MAYGDAVCLLSVLILEVDAADITTDMTPTVDLMNLESLLGLEGQAARLAMVRTSRDDTLAALWV